MSKRERLWQILESGEGNDALSRSTDWFIETLIVLSVVSVILETVQPLGSRYANWFFAFELFCVVVFTLEYGLRLWACTAVPPYRGALRGRLRYMLTPLAVIDLLAIAPFYLFFLGLDFRFLRILRLLRIFKAARYRASLRLFGNAIRARREELLITSGVMFFLLLIASCLMYYAEHAAQPERFTDIPTTMWWAVATLTTVGYGDLAPVTGLGRLLGSVVAVLGIGLFALPAGLLGSGFIEEIQKRKRPPVCPHCGQRTDRPADKDST